MHTIAASETGQWARQQHQQQCAGKCGSNNVQAGAVAALG